VNVRRQIVLPGDLVWAIAILLLAFLLRALMLGGPSLWNDEAFTWKFMRLDWGNAVTALLNDGVHPPFYFFGEKILML
jgi:hypothetical protein